MNTFESLLQLPARPVPDRAEIVRGIARNTRQTVMELVFNPAPGGGAKSDSGTTASK